MADGSILITAEIDSSAFRQALGEMQGELNNFLDFSDNRLIAASAGVLAVIGGTLSALMGTSKRWYETGNLLMTCLNMGMNASAANTVYVGENVLLKIAEGMSAGMAAASGKAAGIMKSIGDSFINYAAEFSDIGFNMMTGMLSGIDKGTEIIYGKINVMCDSVINRVKDKLGIHSPSKVFEQIGENIMLGLRDGISENSVSAENELYRTILNIGDISAPGNILGSSFNAMTAGAVYQASGYYGMPASKTVNNSPVMNFYSPVTTPSQLSRTVRRTMKGLIYG